MRPFESLASDPQQRARYTSAVPLAAAVGLELVEVGPARACMHLPWKPALAGGAGQGIHRGALAVLLDNVCGAAVMCSLETPKGFSTLSLRMEYPQAPPPGADLVAHAQCRHFDGEVAYVQAYASAGEVVVARAAATFIVVHGRAPLHALASGGE